MTSRRTAGHKSRFRAPRAAAGAALALAVGVACVAPAPPDGAAAPVSLYVANALDGTVTRLDSVRGRAMGPPFAAGPKPSKLVAGPGGRLLVLSTSLGQAALTRIVPDTQGGTTQPVPLEPAARQALLAGNGGRHAAVAYHVPAAGTAIGALECRVAFVDLLTGAVERGHNVCGPGEQIVGLALAEDTATVTAYLALWRPPAPGVGPGASGAGRVMEVDVASDAVVASITVA